MVSLMKGGMRDQDRLVYSGLKTVHDVGRKKTYNIDMKYKKPFS
jgi:hypothetical protein